MSKKTWNNIMLGAGLFTAMFINFNYEIDLGLALWILLLSCFGVLYGMTS